MFYDHLNSQQNGRRSAQWRPWTVNAFTEKKF